MTKAKAKPRSTPPPKARAKIAAARTPAAQSSARPTGLAAAPGKAKKGASHIERIAGGASEDDEEHKDLRADLGTRSAFINTMNTRAFAKPICGDIDLVRFMHRTTDRVKKVQAGDLSGVEEMLVSQAMLLDTLFNELVRRAGANLGVHLPVADTYLRLAMKAQGQCRATLQTIGDIKNPRQVVFARQANMANGPQQVNNGTTPQAITPAHAGTSAGSANGLLGESNGERLDFGTQEAPSAAHSEVASVGAVNRPTH